MLRLLGAAALVLLVARPAQALFRWEAYGGSNISSYNPLTQLNDPPALVQSSDFSIPGSGPGCPVPGTANRICGSFLGHAELAGQPPGGRILMHAVARLRWTNAVGDGAQRLVYGGARVTFYGVGFSGTPSPVAQAVFHFGLTGTRAQSSTNAQVVVEASGVASVSADRLYSVQCFADTCEPIPVPVSRDWDPGAPGGTVLRLDLRTDARITAPEGVTFDAEAIADYSDTLELLAVELRDATGTVIPDIQLVVPDAVGNPIYTIANTPGPRPTSTLPGQTTTTTTLPPGCAAGATFSAVGCRLAVLRGAVEALPDGRVATRLGAKVTAAQQAVAGAEQLVARSQKQASKRLAKALTALAGYKRLLKTRGARRALAEDTRAALAAPLAALQADLKALRQGP